jgi:hypothetical protein
MNLILIATVLAGSVIGFTAGRTNAPAAGHITAGVTGFITGIFGTILKVDVEKIDVAATAGFFIIYLVVMYVFYILGNYCRVNKIFENIWGKVK